MSSLPVQGNAPPATNTPPEPVAQPGTETEQQQAPAQQQAQGLELIEQLRNDPTFRQLRQMMRTHPNPQQYLQTMITAMAAEHPEIVQVRAIQTCMQGERFVVVGNHTVSE